MLALRLLFALSVVTPVVRAASTDWPEFRGPTGQGVSTAANVPTHWSDSQNIAWRTELPGTGWSSPVLADGRVYLTAAVKDARNRNATTLHAICLDANSGAIQWDVEVLRPDAAALRAMHPKNSPASSTPIVRGDRLYLHFGHMGTAALD